jgi:hypothetical protein
MKRHPLDPFSLVFGLTFLVLGVLFLATNLDARQLPLRWLWPVPLIVLGGLIVGMAGSRAARARRQEQDDPELQ